MLSRQYGQDYHLFFESYGVCNDHEPNWAGKMNALMSCILRMSEHFIDLDTSSSGPYIRDSMSNFPIVLKSKVKTDPDYPIGSSVGQFHWFDGDTMASYKKVLETAAHWLNEFTAFEVPASNWFTTQYTTGHSPECRDYRYEAGNKPRFNITGRKSTNGEGGETSYDDESVTYTSSSGLIVDNRATYPALCKLYLCLGFNKFTLTGIHDGGPTWNNVEKWQNFSRNVELQSDLWRPTGLDYPYPGKTTKTKRTYGYVNGAWMIKKDRVEETVWSKGTATAYNDNFQMSFTWEEIIHNYEYNDASETIITDETEGMEGEDPSSYYLSRPENKIVVSATLWNGLDLWSDPYTPLTETIPAHTKKRLTCNTFQQIPIPTYDYESFIGDDYERGAWRWNESVAISYDMRVVPVVDFSESLTTYSFGEEG